MKPINVQKFVTEIQTIGVMYLGKLMPNSLTVNSIQFFPKNSTGAFHYVQLKLYTMIENHG